VNESQRRAFAALGIGPLWRLRGTDATQADASLSTCADAPVLLALSDEAGGWLFVVEADPAFAGERGALLRADAMRLLERMLAALGLRPAQPAVALAERAGGLGGPGSESGTPVDAFAPQVIVALGDGAARALLAADAPLAALRGRVHAWGTGARAIPLVVSAHPSQLLATPREKAAAWADLCLARAARAQVLGASSAHPDTAPADPAGADSVSACSVRSAPPNRTRAGSPDGDG